MVCKTAHSIADVATKSANHGSTGVELFWLHFFSQCTQAALMLDSGRFHLQANTDKIGSSIHFKVVPTKFFSNLTKSNTSLNYLYLRLIFHKGPTIFHLVKKKTLV